MRNQSKAESLTFCEKRQHILKPRAHTVQSCSLQGDKGRLMGFREYLKSFLGSETLKAPPERHLDADSEAGLSASLVTLVAGAKGWISTEEARRLFSPVHDPQYTFGELDSIGKENLESFARRNHCNPEILPSGRVYFARKREPFVGG
jgi:hypothetical protein